LVYDVYHFKKNEQSKNDIQNRGCHSKKLSCIAHTQDAWVKKMSSHRNVWSIKFNVQQTEFKNIYRVISDKVYPVSADTVYHIFNSVIGMLIINIGPNIQFFIQVKKS